MLNASHMELNDLLTFLLKRIRMSVAAEVTYDALKIE
jgi:hypothetical protein